MIEFLGSSLGLIFGLCPEIMTQNSKTLRISWLIGASFFLMTTVFMGFRIASGLKLLTTKTKPWLESCNFQPYPYLWGNEDWANNRSCPDDEASLRICKRWGSESFQIGESTEVPGGWHTREGMKPPFSFLLTLPIYLFSWLFICIHYNKPVNVS